MRTECTSARAWLSAFRDDEALDDRPARAHVETCDACAVWADTADALTRRLRLRASGSPDFLGPALAAWDAAASAGASRQTTVARGILGVAGVGGLLLAVLGLLDVPGYMAKAGTHLGWELYSFEAALAVGFLLAAWRPQRHMAGLLPVAALVAVLSIVPSVLGLVALPANALMELSHLAVLVGVAGLLLLADARRRGGLGPTPAGATQTAPVRSRLA